MSQQAITVALNRQLWNPGDQSDHTALIVILLWCFSHQYHSPRLKFYQNKGHWISWYVALVWQVLYLYTPEELPKGILEFLDDDNDRNQCYHLFLILVTSVLDGGLKSSILTSFGRENKQVLFWFGCERGVTLNKLVTLQLCNFTNVLVLWSRKVSKLWAHQ